MNRKSTALVIVLASWLSLPTVYSQGWNGIIPTETHRKDVERILGECKEDYPSSCLYTTDEQNMHISYSSGEPCSHGEPLNVPSGTVLSMAIFPRRTTYFTDLGFDLKEFVIEHDPEIVGVRQYANLTKGITFETRKDVVIGIYLSPTRMAFEKLQCK